MQALIDRSSPWGVFPLASASDEEQQSVAKQARHRSKFQIFALINVFSVANLKENLGFASYLLVYSCCVSDSKYYSLALQIFLELPLLCLFGGWRRMGKRVRRRHPKPSQIKLASVGMSLTCAWSTGFMFLNKIIKI